MGVGDGGERRGQPPFGWVPEIKYSCLPKQEICMIFSPGKNGLSGVSLRSSFIISCQIGAAPVTPEVRVGCMGELSLFPTQTAVTKSSV